METNIHFFIISRSFFFLLKMWNIWDESSRENQNTHFILNNSPPPENRAVYESMWKSIVESGRPQKTIWWRMRFEYWITKATNTHSIYVVLTAFPLQQWFHDAPHCYVIRTLPVFLMLNFAVHGYRCFEGLLSDLMWFWPCIVVNMWK